MLNYILLGILVVMLHFVQHDNEQTWVLKVANSVLIFGTPYAKTRSFYSKKTEK